MSQLPVSRLTRAAATTAVVALGLTTLGCSAFVSKPQLSVLKSPVGECKDADCPTVEVPAPMKDGIFNPVDFKQLDGKDVETPLVFGQPGMTWQVMKIPPGKHTIFAASREDREGQSFGESMVKGLASMETIEFTAEKGRRYWLWGGRKSKDSSFFVWLEEGTLDRTFVGGSDMLKQSKFSKVLEMLTPDDGAPPYQYDVRTWWASAPQLDRTFQKSERVGEVATFGADPVAWTKPLPPAAPAADQREAGGT